MVEGVRINQRAPLSMRYDSLGLEQLVLKVKDGQELMRMRAQELNYDKWSHAKLFSPGAEKELAAILLLAYAVLGKKALAQAPANS